MINTVLGPIKNGSLGTTYIHEHLYVYPDAQVMHQDYTLDDLDKNIAEVISFKNSGGDTLVDLTPINYGRSPMLLRKISQASGVNIICITGFHKEEFQPKWLENMSNKDVYDFLTHEIIDGIGTNKILPGAMKLGTSKNTITDSEKRVIDVEGNVQRDTHIPIVTHCDQGTMGLDQLAGLKAAGADLTHVCLSHVDLSEDVDYIKRICDTGASISFDHIGRHLKNKDSLRINMITNLVNSGYSDNICLAGDMGRKKYFISYGGEPGLKYILTDLKSELLQHISETDYAKMVTTNPHKVLIRQ
ncbi:phosphotriesterase family protein [Loigolactobacillus iwatensis]|uniref:phosphotriesterase family protein n=1 Tax=Loigolactobacillus iwatensis TaxID=1267156 RepID=UPI000F7F81E5|nr:aryldialkylphosphatase [Loigolactobacillus iwatensis]